MRMLFKNFFTGYSGLKNTMRKTFQIVDFLEDRFGRFQDLERSRGMTAYNTCCPRCNCTRFRKVDDKRRKCKNCLFIWKLEQSRYRSDDDWKFELIRVGPLAGYGKYNVRPSLYVDEDGKIDTNINYDNKL